MGLKTGTLAAANDTVVLQKLSQDYFCVATITGTFSTLVINVEAAIGSGRDTPDSADWAPLSFITRAVYARDVDNSLSFSTAQAIEFNGSGFKWVRVKCASISSGSATVVMYCDNVSQQTVLGGG